MDDFESELNVINNLLKNNETYTKFTLKQKHYNHYNTNKSMYRITYNYNNFKHMIINALQKNTHVNEIYITITIADQNKWEGYFIDKIIKMKNWKSIFVYGQSAKVLDALLCNQNQKLIKLELSQICSNGEKFLKIIQNTPSLEHFELDIACIQDTDLPFVIHAIYESNIQTLILNNIHIINSSNKFIDDVLKSKIKNIHLKYSNTNDFDLTNNYHILNFSINGKCSNYALEILNRNKLYIFTILLCMNRKIIPRCVFKNLILKNL